MRSRGLIPVLGCIVSCSAPSTPGGEDTGGSSTGSGSIGTGSRDDTAGQAAESDGGSTDELGGSSTGGTSEGGVDTWDDPVDCQNHRPTGPSFVRFAGALDGEDVEGACDFLNEWDWVNYCQGDQVGFMASCTSADGEMQFSLQVAPVSEGEFDDPHGTPRFTVDVFKGADGYATGNQNATHAVLVVDTLDEGERTIAGTFEGAWYDLTLAGMRFPDGSLTGDFEISF